MTLKQIAELAAERTGRQFEIPFRREVEDMIVYKRARFLKQTLEKNPSQGKYYMYSIIVEMEEVNKEDCEELADCGCENVLRSVDTIPDSVRFSSQIFSYVGSPGGADAYAYTTFGSEKYFRSNPYTSKRPRWTLLNSRLYLFREKNATEVRLEYVPADPRELSKFKCPGSDKKSCYTESTDFLMNTEMIDLIVNDLLQKELSQKPQQDDVEIYADKNK